MSFVRELFEDDSGRASMSRLLTFLSFPPATWIVCSADNLDKTDIFLIYIGAYVLGYLGGKTADVFKSNSRRGQDDGNS